MFTSRLAGCPIVPCIALSTLLALTGCRAAPQQELASLEHAVAPPAHAEVPPAAAPAPQPATIALSPSSPQPESLLPHSGMGASAAQDAPAEPYPNLYKRFGLAVGAAAYSNFNTTLRVDSDLLVGAVLDLEDTLGVDESSTVLRLDTFYSFNKRHRIDASFYDISRGGSRGIDEDIQVGDVVIPAGSSVDTDFDTLLFKVAYRYNFIADTRTAIGASFGLHGMRIDASLAAENIAIEESFKATVPLPVLGLHWEYALSPTWKLLTSVELLQVDIGDARGFLSDRRLTIEHNPFRNFGWGLGYNGFELDATIEGDGSLTGIVDYSYQGMMLFLRWYM